jgi:hypothetical protein
MAPRNGHCHLDTRLHLAKPRRILMLVFTLALGMALFATFYGLIVACDRL